jgi:hypothetical protein
MPLDATKNQDNKTKKLENTAHIAMRSLRFKSGYITFKKDAGGIIL